MIGLTKEELAGAPTYTTDELTAYGGSDIDYRDSIKGFYRRFFVPH